MAGVRGFQCDLTASKSSCSRSSAPGYLIRSARALFHFFVDRCRGPGLFPRRRWPPMDGTFARVMLYTLGGCCYIGRLSKPALQQVSLPSVAFGGGSASVARSLGGTLTLAGLLDIGLGRAALPSCIPIVESQSHVLLLVWLVYDAPRSLLLCMTGNFTLAIRARGKFFL